MTIGILCAAICQGLVGFGFGLLSIPVLACFMDIKQAIIIGVILTFVHYLMLLTRSYKLLMFQKTLLIFLSSILGMFLGVWIFVSIDQVMLKMITGFVVFCSGLLLMSGYFPNLGESPYVRALVGLSGGVLQAMTGMGGPPFIIYYASRKMNLEEFRSVLITLFLIISGISCLMLVLTPAAGWSTFWYGLIFLPAVVVGHELGVRLVGVVNERIFRLIVDLLVIFSGVSLILNAVQNMFG